MSNPATMGLGGVAFHAHGFSYDRRKRKVDTKWVPIPVAGAPDVFQWTGGRSTEVDIGGVLFPKEFGGLGSLRAIEAMALAGSVVPLFAIGGGSNFGGMYAIQGIDEDHTFIAADGTPLRDAFKIELTLYQGSSFRPTSVITFF